MYSNARRTDAGHRLIQIGVLLLLLGLLTGLTIPMAANPRMGLASHLQGIINGLLLIGLGLVHPRLRLGLVARRTLFGLVAYGTFANWFATLLAAFWGAGAAMPIAGGGRHGSTVQEWVITGLLWTLTLAMLAVCVIVLVGLRRGAPVPAAEPDPATA
jgi:hydroxylaminobenzene mutase